jgi:fructuronate reductase
MRFVLCVDDHGLVYDIRDPLAARLVRIGQSCGRNAARLAEALFAIIEIFTPELLAQEAFRAQVVKDLDQILTVGIRPALTACTRETSPTGTDPGHRT